MKGSAATPGMNRTTLCCPAEFNIETSAPVNVTRSHPSSAREQLSARVSHTRPSGTGCFTFSLSL